MLQSLSLFGILQIEIEQANKNHLSFLSQIVYKVYSENLEFCQRLLIVQMWNANEKDENYTV